MYGPVQDDGSYVVIDPDAPSDVVFGDGDDDED
jgi:hypothetical protein